MLDTFGRTSGSQTTQPILNNTFMESLEPLMNGQNVSDRTSGSQTTQPILNKTIRKKSLADWNSTAIQDNPLWLDYNHDRKSMLNARIWHFSSYQKNWDGDGATEIPLSAIYQSLNFLNTFRRYFAEKEPSSAAASPDGEIVLYWCNPIGYAEINFNGNEKLSMCWGYGSDEIELIEEDFEITNNFDKSRIGQALSNFLTQNDWEQENKM